SFLGHPELLASELSDHLPVTCDLVVKLAAPVPNTPPAGQLMMRWQWLTLVLAALLLLSAGWSLVSRKRFFSSAQLTDSSVGRLLAFPDEARDPLAVLEFAEENELPGPGLPLHIPVISPAHSQIQALERRAIAAEQRAARATEVVRKGLVP